VGWSGYPSTVWGDQKNSGNKPIWMLLQLGNIGRGKRTCKGKVAILGKEEGGESRV